MGGYDSDRIKYFKASRAYIKLLNEDPADYVHKGLSSSWDGSIIDDNLNSSYLYHEVHEIEDYLNGIMIYKAEDQIDSNSYIPLPYDLLNSYMDDYINSYIKEVSFEFPYDVLTFHRKFQTDQCSYALSNVFEETIDDRDIVKEIDDIHEFNI